MPNWNRRIPLQFQDTRSYKDRIKAQQEKTGRKDAMVIGQGGINGRKVALCVFDFGFMGGSMGSVVGEKICRAVDRALEARLPFILVTASAGPACRRASCRSCRWRKLRGGRRIGEAKLPFVSIWPTQHSAGSRRALPCWGMSLSPNRKRLIGFAGPRVIEQTIKQQFPDQFQRAEFLLDHGMIDMIVERKQLKEAVSTLVGHF